MIYIIEYKGSYSIHYNLEQMMTYGRSLKSLGDTFRVYRINFEKMIIEELV